MIPIYEAVLVETQQDMALLQVRLSVQLDNCSAAGSVRGAASYSRAMKLHYTPPIIINMTSEAINTRYCLVPVLLTHYMMEQRVHLQGWVSYLYYEYIMFYSFETTFRIMFLSEG